MLNKKLVKYTFKMLIYVKDDTKQFICNHLLITKKLNIKLVKYTFKMLIYIKDDTKQFICNHLLQNTIRCKNTR